MAELWDSDAGDTEGEEDGPSARTASPGAHHNPSKQQQQQQQNQGWSIYGLADVEGRLFGSSMSFGAGGEDNYAGVVATDECTKLLCAHTTKEGAGSHDLYS